MESQFRPFPLPLPLLAFQNLQGLYPIERSFRFHDREALIRTNVGELPLHAAGPCNFDLLHYAGMVAPFGKVENPHVREAGIACVAGAAGIPVDASWLGIRLLY